MDKRRTPNFDIGHWTNAAAPAALSSLQWTAALGSYQAWTKEHGRHITFEAYLAYILGSRSAVPEQPGFTILADQSKVAGPGAEAGWSRRKRHLADLLSGAYESPNSASMRSAGVETVEISEAHGTATLRLVDGSWITDHGDRMTLHEATPYRFGVGAVAAAAARRGWQSARLTGPQAFQDEAARVHAILDAQRSAEPARPAPADSGADARIALPSPGHDISGGSAGASADPAQDAAALVARALKIARPSIAESNLRIAAILAGRPDALDDAARRCELIEFERAARDGLIAAARQAELFAQEKRRLASLLDAQSRREARDAETAAQEARQAEQRYAAINADPGAAIERRVETEIAVRQRMQQAFDQDPATRMALDEQAANRLLLAGLHSGEPALVSAILTGGLEVARILLKRQQR